MAGLGTRTSLSSSSSSLHQQQQQQQKGRRRKRKDETKVMMKAAEIPGHIGEKTVDEALSFINDNVHLASGGGNVNKKQLRPEKREAKERDTRPIIQPVQTDGLFQKLDGKGKKKRSKTRSGNKEERGGSEADEMSSRTSELDERSEDTFNDGSTGGSDHIRDLLVPKENHVINHLDLFEPQKYIFTDFVPLPQKEEEFTVVSKKKKQQQQQQQQMQQQQQHHHHQQQQHHYLRPMARQVPKDCETPNQKSIAEVPRRRGRGPARSFTPPPAFTPPPSATQDGAGSDRALSPSAFPVLGSTREGRRSSTGDMPSECGNDDSDMESVKSVPLVTSSSGTSAKSLGSSSSQTFPVSYATIAAGRAQAKLETKDAHGGSITTNNDEPGSRKDSLVTSSSSSASLSLGSVTSPAEEPTSSVLIVTGQTGPATLSGDILNPSSHNEEEDISCSEPPQPHKQLPQGHNKSLGDECVRVETDASSLPEPQSSQSANRNQSSLSLTPASEAPSSGCIDDKASISGAPTPVGNMGDNVTSTDTGSRLGSCVGTSHAGESAVCVEGHPLNKSAPVNKADQISIIRPEHLNEEKDVQGNNSSAKCVITFDCETSPSLAKSLPVMEESPGPMLVVKETLLAHVQRGAGKQEEPSSCVARASHSGHINTSDLSMQPTKHDDDVLTTKPPVALTRSMNTGSNSGVSDYSTITVLNHNNKCNKSKSVIFLDKRMNERPHNLGISFGFEPELEKCEISSSVNNKKAVTMNVVPSVLGNALCDNNNSNAYNVVSNNAHPTTNTSSSSINTNSRQSSSRERSESPSGSSSDTPMLLVAPMTKPKIAPINGLIAPVLASGKLVASLVTEKAETDISQWESVMSDQSPTDAECANLADVRSSRSSSLSSSSSKSSNPASANQFSKYNHCNDPNFDVGRFNHEAAVSYVYHDWQLIQDISKQDPSSVCWYKEKVES